MRWIEKIVRVVVGCVALVIALASVLLVVVYFHFSHSPPAIADGIPLGPNSGTNQRLTAAILRTVAEGSREGALRALLDGQGFKPLPPPPVDCLSEGQRPILGQAYVSCYDNERILRYKWSNGLVCGEAISVSWRGNDRGEVVDVKAVYSQTCL